MPMTDLSKLTEEQLRWWQQGASDEAEIRRINDPRIRELVAWLEAMDDAITARRCTPQGALDATRRVFFPAPWDDVQRWALRSLDRVLKAVT